VISKRIQRVNQLIKQEISKLIFKEIESPKDSLITVTRVISTPDLKTAKVFISVIPEEKKTEAFLSLNRKIYQLQQGINKRLKMKIVPKLIFVEEKMTASAARIEKILEGLKKEE
jgi:ribosome-binding factor A